MSNSLKLEDVNKTVVKPILFFFLAISTFCALDIDSKKNSLFKKKTSSAFILEESANEAEENHSPVEEVTLTQTFTKNLAFSTKKSKQKFLLETKTQCTFQVKFYALKTAPPFDLLLKA